MQFNKPLVIAFTLCATFLGSNCSAQQDGNALLHQCLKTHSEEFQPLAQERDVINQRFSNRSSSVRYIVRWLEADPKTADANRLKEIAQLEARLKAFQDHANLTSAEATEDAAATIELANIAVEDINDERESVLKPLGRRRSALQRKYKRQEDQLKPVLVSLFRESGDSETTADLKKAYGSFSYSSGTASCSYKRENEIQSVCNFYIYLVNDKVAVEKLGKLDDRYPLAYRSKHQIEVLVGDCRVTAYSKDPAFKGEALDAMLLSLFDFEKLEGLLAPTN